MKKRLVFTVLMLFVALSLFANITREEAERIAINEAGLVQNDNLRIRTSLEWERGERVYDVEIYFDGIEYDYEIALKDGRILSFDQEADRIRYETSSNAINREDAISIALDLAGLTSSDVSRIKAERDRDDGLVTYEVEFRDQNNKYEYEIDENGNVRSYQIEKRTNQRHSRDAILLERAKAEEILKAFLPSEASLRGLSRDYDDGLYTYEAKAYYDGIEYEVEIDAVNGDLISYSEERR